MLSRFRQSETDSERGDAASTPMRWLSRWARGTLPSKSFAAVGVVEGLAATATVTPRPTSPSRRRSVDWERQFDRRCADVWDVALAEEGFVFAGTTAAADGRGPDFWLAETDGDGRERWSHSFGSDGVDIARSVLATGDDGYVVAGTTSSATDADNGAVLARVNRDGAVRWQRTFGGDGFDVCRALARADDGYVFAGGTQSGTANGQDVWLVGVSADGERTWSRTFSRSQGDVVSAVRPTRDGGFLLVGQTFGDGTDCWVIKTDREGRREWDRTLSNGESDVARSVVDADDGHVIVGTTSPDGDARTDVWMTKLDTGGDREWERSIGGAGTDVASGVDRTSDGGFVVAGETTSFGESASAMLLKVDEDGGREWVRTVGDGSAAHAGPLRVGGGEYLIAGGASDRTWTSDGRGWATKISAI